MGWTEGSGQAAVESKPTETKAETGEEDIWDDEETSKQHRAGGGMGNSVSTMTVEEGDEVRGERTLHSLARVGDVEGLKAFLQSHPTTDLNSVDANVNIQQHPSTHVGAELYAGIHAITPVLRQRTLGDR